MSQFVWRSARFSARAFVGSPCCSGLRENCDVLCEFELVESEKKMAQEQQEKKRKLEADDARDRTIKEAKLRLARERVGDAALSSQSAASSDMPVEEGWT